MKVFLTGMPRTGKTTLVSKFLKGFPGKVTGIITRETRKAGQRTGFRIEDLVTGEKGTLARIGGAGPRVGKYSVDVDDLERVSLPALSRKADLTVIDELGAMEFKSRAFKQKVDDLMHSDKDLLAVLHRRWVSEYRKYGKVIEVTSDNHEKVLAELEKLFSE